MPAKLDGTNGLLQQYDYQAPTTGFSYTFAAGVNVLVMQPAGTLATGTITMPASPSDGMSITFSSTRTITALTVNANTGQSIVSAPTVLPANQVGAYVYRLSNTTWYPFETVPTNVPVAPAGGSIITSGTVNAGGTNPFPSSAGPTVVDFTGIPSWVKRITVMFQGVSSNSTSLWLLQLGTSSGVTTSGYLGRVRDLGSVTSAYSAGFTLLTDSTNGAILHGLIQVVTLGSNNFAMSGILSRSDGANQYISGGSITLGGTLDRVRITTVIGTETFDAGSINILYE
jgi:hypothetical protein